MVRLTTNLTRAYFVCNNPCHRLMHAEPYIMAPLLSWSLQKCAARGLWCASLPELAVYTALGGRFMSTQPSTPSFKAQTRALLKKVHHDLFHDNQEARVGPATATGTTQQFHLHIRFGCSHLLPQLPGKGTKMFF